MKLASIRIKGMHNVVDKTYDLSDFNYLYGDNGAGKSTVLQAIQLALLGYIPGTKKLSSEIFKHSNSASNTMGVRLIISDDSEYNHIQIERTWVNTGKAIVTDVNITPEDTDIDELIGDLKLPILDFSEFKNMTANKLKDWFINYLPPSRRPIEWDTTFRQCLEDFNLSAESKETVCDQINKLLNIAKNNANQIDAVRAINEHLKNEVSFKKGRIEQLQSTIQSLVYYDDSDLSNVDALQSELTKLNEELQQLNAIEPALKQYIASKAKFDTFVSENDCNFNVSLEANPEYLKLNATFSDKSEKIRAIRDKVNQLNVERSQISAEIMANERILSSNGMCPYTNTKCDTIQSTIDDIYANNDTLTAKLSKIDTDVLNANHQIQYLMQENEKISAKIINIQSLYRQYDIFKSSVPEVPLIDGKPYDGSQSVDAISSNIYDISVRKSQIEDQLIKAKANAKYDELFDKLTKEVAIWTEVVNVYKAWISLTDVNGLQTDLMHGPFATLAKVMTKYLNIFFHNDSVSAEFNLSSKANSFGFGMNIDGIYLDFDLLSSGEKCLYTISLITALIEASSPQLPIILIDDLLDHVDDNKIQILFDTLYKTKDIQIILAGVQKCLHPDANKFVIEVK